MNELSQIIIDLTAQGYQIVFNKGNTKGCLGVELQIPELQDHLRLTINQEVSFQAVEIANLDVLKYSLESMKDKIIQYKKDNE